MNCGAPVGHEDTCPNCGCDLSIQRKAVQRSNSFYNRALDKAKVRDLSGAADLLERSLKFNKRNISARNLLGLIYFETGEMVSALSEWIISKNIKPSDNIACDYIDALQSNPEDLDAINQSVKRYNRALEACRDGNEDIAEMMLKKVVTVNPHLIKAYHLLALIYMKDRQWEKARGVLKKALPIDRTNDVTMRYLQEVDEQTGKETSPEGGLVSKVISPEKKNAFFTALENITGRSAARNKLVIDDEVFNDTESRINDADTVQPVAFHETSPFSGFLYIILGIIMGILVVWFLVVPSVKQEVSRTANEQVAELNTVIAKQTAQIEEKDAQIAGYDESVTTVSQQLGQASTKTGVMEQLVQGYNAFRSGNYEMARSILSTADATVLSSDAQAMLTNLLADTSQILYTTYLTAGVAAYNGEDYVSAIEWLARAVEAKPAEYDALSYLGNAYRLTGQYENAMIIYNQIIALFPGTQRAEAAQNYIYIMNRG